MLLKPFERRSRFAFVQLSKRHFAGDEPRSGRRRQALLKNGASERVLAGGVVNAPDDEGPKGRERVAFERRAAERDRLRLAPHRRQQERVAQEHIRIARADSGRASRSYSSKAPTEGTPARLQ